MEGKNSTPENCSLASIYTPAAHIINACIFESKEIKGVRRMKIKQNVFERPSSLKSSRAQF